MAFILTSVQKKNQPQHTTKAPLKQKIRKRVSSKRLNYLMDTGKLYADRSIMTLKKEIVRSTSVLPHSLT